MLRFALLLLLNCIISSYACNRKYSEAKITTPLPHGVLLGSVSSLTEEDMSDSAFQSALTEVLKHLEEVNKCHSFQLVKVIDATKQIVADVKYTMKLELKPSFSEESEEDCSDFTDSFVDKKKIAEVSVVSKALGDPKYIVTFHPTSHFESDGTMKFTAELNTWSDMTPEEFKMPVFQKAIQEAIDKLNRDVDKCFHYEFVEMVDGEKMLSSKLNYKWRMKVAKNYEYQRQECMKLCADDCSGTDVYSARAFVSPPENGTPQLTEVKFEKRLSASIADDYEPGWE